MKKKIKNVSTLNKNQLWRKVLHFFFPPLWSFNQLTSYLGRNEKLNSSHHLLRVTVSFHELLLEQLLVWWMAVISLSLKAFTLQIQTNSCRKLTKAWYSQLSTPCCQLLPRQVSSYRQFSFSLARLFLFRVLPDCPTNLKICQQTNTKRSQQHSLNYKYEGNRFKSIWGTLCKKFPSQTCFEIAYFWAASIWNVKKSLHFLLFFKIIKEFLEFFDIRLETATILFPMICENVINTCTKPCAVLSYSPCASAVCIHTTPRVQARWQIPMPSTSSSAHVLTCRAQTPSPAWQVKTHVRPSDHCL